MFFSFNFLFELLLSKNRWAFVMSILGIVDLVTIVPVFVALSSDPVVKSPTGFVRLYRVLMLARVRISAVPILTCCDATSECKQKRRYPRWLRSRSAVSVVGIKWRTTSTRVVSSISSTVAQVSIPCLVLLVRLACHVV